MAIISPTPKQQFFDTNGSPLVGGKLFTYETGTTIKATTYTDETEGTQNANPIELNARGECDLWLPTGSFTLGLYPATETDDPPSGVSIWTVNDIQGSGGEDTNTDSISSLRALSAGSTETVHVKGYYTDNDGGGGLFFWNETDTSVDDGGSVIVPDSAPATGRWNRIIIGRLNARWWGAKGDGSTDDSTVIQTALTYAGTNQGDIYFPNGTYKHTTGLTVPVGCKIIMSSKARFTAGSAFAVTFATATTVGYATFECGITKCFDTDSSTGSFPIFARGSVDAVYPQWFGAVGDGTNDDTLAINSAIDQLNGSYLTDADRVKKLIFPAPSDYYSITAALTPIVDVGGFEIIGYGGDELSVSQNEPVIKYEGTTTANHVMTFDSTTGIRVSGIVIECEDLIDGINYIADNQGDGLISRHSKIDQVRCYNANKYGLSINQSGQADQIDTTKFENCLFEASKGNGDDTAGMFAQGGNTYAAFDECQFSGDFGVRLKDGGYTFVNWCQANSCTTAAFDITGVLQGGLRAENFYSETTNKFFQTTSGDSSNIKRSLHFTGCVHFPAAGVDSTHDNSQDLIMIGNLFYGYTSLFTGNQPNITDLSNTFQNVTDYQATAISLLQYHTDDNSGTPINYFRIKGQIENFRDRTATLAVSTLYSNQHFTNEGAAGNIVFTLPTARDGQTLSFFIVAAHQVTITPDSGEKIVGITAADGDSIAAGAIGDFVTLVGKSSDWYVKEIYGSWGGNSEKSVEKTITASVTQTQGQQALTKDIVEVSICANEDDVVTLPLAVTGLEISIIHNGSETLQVFPASGDAINGQSVNLSITQGARINKVYRCIDSTNWYSFDVFRETVSKAITAGTTQTQGQEPLNRDINEINTCANEDDVVTLPAAVAGLNITVINNGANRLQVFPSSGADINDGTTNVSVFLNVGHKLIFKAIDSTSWYTFGGNGLTSVSVTADVGSAQGGTPVTSELVNISICANTGDSVTLPSAVAGLSVILTNNGANAADIFPASGDNLGGGVNNASSLAAGSNIRYVAVDVTNWEII